MKPWQLRGAPDLWTQNLIGAARKARAGDGKEPVADTDPGGLASVLPLRSTSDAATKLFHRPAQRSWPRQAPPSKPKEPKNIFYCTRLNDIVVHDLSWRRAWCRCKSASSARSRSLTTSKRRGRSSGHLKRKKRGNALHMCS